MHITKSGQALWIMIIIIMVIMISATSYIRSLNQYRAIISSYITMWKKHHTGELCLALIKAHILDDSDQNSYHCFVNNTNYNLSWSTDIKNDYSLTKYTIINDNGVWAQGTISCNKDHTEWLVQKSTIRYAHDS